MLLLKTITQENWRLVANLSVSSEQTTFIESNKDSLLEAAFDKTFDWIPLALYDDNVLVGFTMIGDFKEVEKSIWLDRFMIDQHFQGQKYGKKFLKTIVEHIKHNWSVETIFLSATKENKKIFSFYESVGFINTHTLDEKNGEVIMTLTF